MSTSSPADPAVSPDVVEIESTLTRIAYLSNRARQHERLMALAGLSLDRAGAALLRQLAERESMRPGELAARLSVEASHVTRQVQHLERSGFVTRVPDPDDRRAQRVQLTEAGRAAVRRVRAVSCQGMQAALADWSPEDLHRLATLFRRMVDDFVSHGDEEAAAPPSA
ncbi:MarR family winged helix-turn-helix transcriptional regulator [Streptomyces millisiae]|uniref:MarR family transcriptional regulator n=1 Tax=Streptomyces millisiae TaxID=3075542 RepID=A0ABU2LKF1_9ACTN|nr:MarR family transcriptional regulator [Streptomyces sp. DSM 44918]MDT0317727.1 MarR family transcriptional regulator [Streptomyces sp. DSM 44918]